ncbi:hypothetical protein [Streptomyces sp. NPDC093591]|uniref:hypothetical protein n=1 Tax=Streptomyces sp. NPDC093591 TaxID=3366044 RepID=UPI00381417BD
MAVCFECVSGGVGDQLTNDDDCVLDIGGKSPFIQDVSGEVSGMLQAGGVGAEAAGCEFSRADTHEQAPVAFFGMGAQTSCERRSFD